MCQPDRHGLNDAFNEWLKLNDAPEDIPYLKLRLAEYGHLTSNGIACPQSPCSRQRIGDDFLCFEAKCEEECLREPPKTLRCCRERWPRHSRRCRGGRLLDLWSCRRRESSRFVRAN